MIARDGDAADPHIPLLTWWVVERHALTHRAKVMELFGGSTAWQQRISAEHMLLRLAQRYGAEGNDQGLGVVAALMRSAPGPREGGKLLEALAEAYKGRRIENPPQALREAVEALGAHMPVLKVKLGLASEADVKNAIASIATNDKPLEWIEALGTARNDAAVPALLEVARDNRSTAVRKGALHALQQFADSRIGLEIVAQWPAFQTDATLRTSALELLSRRKAWSLEMLKAISARTIVKSDVPFDVVERVKRHEDSAVSKLVSQIWGRTRQSPAELRERMAAVAKTLRDGAGDESRGKAIFAATCASCHKLHGSGQTIGPDLTGYERDNLDFMLLAIIDPNAALREEYTNFELETTDDLLLTGYVVDRSAQAVTIEDAQQGRVTIPQSRIRTLKASPVSRMPEGLLDGLSETQIRDLFAFLKSNQ
ncbi:MAG: c-type cytochrome, partial [Acidobacteriales bacterium]|nr:c-type cytochrome [Terriglobales bacterium]